MNDMNFDNGFRELLKSVQLDSALERTSLQLLNKEILHICEENISGNIVQLPDGDPASALLLAWVVRHCTREPRNLFLPEKVLREYGLHFQAIGSGSWIKVVDATLQGKKHSQNWLGMVALLHDAEARAPRLVTITELLGSQLVENATMLFEGENGGLAEMVSAGSCWQVQQVCGQDVVMTWQQRPTPNPEISPLLVSEFHEDDPVASGIPTLMSANERFQLYYAVRKLLPCNSRLIRFVEVGSFAGGSFYAIGRGLQRQGLPFQGIAVEPNSGSILESVIKEFGSSAIHIPMMSHEAAPVLSRFFEAGNLPQFVLIDGDHSFESVSRDIRDYYPLVAPGGIIMFHDYLPPCDDTNAAFVIDRKETCHFGIGEACRESLETEHALQPLTLPLLYPANPAQSLASQPIIPDLFSSIRAYRKPESV